MRPAGITPYCTALKLDDDDRIPPQATRCGSVSVKTWPATHCFSPTVKLRLHSRKV